MRSSALFIIPVFCLRELVSNLEFGLTLAADFFYIADVSWAFFAKPKDFFMNQILCAGFILLDVLAHYENICVVEMKVWEFRRYGWKGQCCMSFLVVVFQLSG